jgi:DNA polymerase-1
VRVLQVKDADLSWLEGCEIKLFRPDKAAEFLGELEAVGSVAVDTETTSKDWMQARIVGVGVALSPTKAWYFTSVEDVPAALWKKKCVMWNAKYDLGVLRRAQVRIANFEDAMILYWQADPNNKDTGLKNAARGVFGLGMLRYEDVVPRGARIEDVDSGRLAVYCCSDAIMTLRLWESQQFVRHRQGFVYELDKRLTECLLDMEEDGVPVDSEFLTGMEKEVQKETDERLKEFLASVKREAARRGFDVDLAELARKVNSPAYVGELLFGKLGLPSAGKTNILGRYCTRADVIRSLRGKSSVVDRLLRYREAAKELSGFVKSLQEFVREDGRVHPDIRLERTATGRLAFRNPNLQNLPKKSDKQVGRYRFRDAIVAPKGHVLLAADHKGVELRILASLARAGKWCELFEKDSDLHDWNTTVCFGITKDSVSSQMWEDRRRDAKTVIFGLVYGMGDSALGSRIGKSPSQARLVREKLFEAVPEVKRYMKAAAEFARRFGYVKTYFGRRRPIPWIRSSDEAERKYGERRAVNTPIQGTSADLMKIAMIRIHDALRGDEKCRCVLQVHDELVFVCRRQHLHEYALKIKRLMEFRNLPGMVPIVAEVSVGKAFGSMTELRLG